MALIQCTNCGKEVSDRAKVCPNCGAQLIADIPPATQETPKTIICEECGTEFLSDADACPNCGCPAPAADNLTEQEPQKVEVTSVKLRVKKSTKRYIFIAAIVVIAIALIAVIVSNIQKQKEEQAAATAIATYESNLKSATVSMLAGAADAENAGNLIKSVWYNSIYEERDSETDKYTRPNGYFYDDFNDALGELFSDSSFQSSISEIEVNQNTVMGLMQELQKPPEGFEDAYEAIKDLYDAYLELTNLAINPQGSLQTYSTSFNDADSNVLKYYNTMELYIDG